MRALTLIFLLNIIPAMVFAGNINMNGSGEDCSLTRALTAGLSGLPKALCTQAVKMYKEGRQTQENVVTLCRGIKNTAWYQDRDNSMSDANNEVGDAMAVVLGPNGTATQSVQVCPGVYLATAHGALDSPILARENNRPVQPIVPGSIRILAYPMSRETMMRANDKNDYISPRLRDPSLWENGNEESDYVFIKVGNPVGNPVRPNSFVTPLSVTPEELVQNKSSVEVHMYRGKSRYRNAETGAPDHSEEYAIARSDIRSLINLYQQPQKVNSSCSVSRVFDYIRSYVSHNCPTESGASGASYVSKIGSTNYLMGLHTIGSSNNIESSKHTGGSTMLTSSAFCADYQTACGKPCPKFKDVD